MSRKKANNKVFEIPTNFGDDLHKKREVTHWFYFKKREDLDRFESYGNDIGFNTIHKDLKKRKGHDNLLLLLFRIESPEKNAIDFDTMEFFEIAQEI